MKMRCTSYRNLFTMGRAFRAQKTFTVSQLHM